MALPDAEILAVRVFAVCCGWAIHIIQQKCLKKWIGSVHLGTRRYNFQPPTQTPSATMHFVTDRQTDRQYCANILLLWPAVRSAKMTYPNEQNLLKIHKSQYSTIAKLKVPDNHYAAAYRETRSSEQWPVAVLRWGQGGTAPPILLRPPNLLVL